ncbi:MAG TPA: hypothetical protein VKB80_16655, partial [Kofleriaceae bacterium]|nr:hypothetical protein [Kofleriaceae bacterium]
MAPSATRAGAPAVVAAGTVGAVVRGAASPGAEVVAAGVRAAPPGAEVVAAGVRAAPPGAAGADVRRTSAVAGRLAGDDVGAAFAAA